jgi:GT2 family glycosyltransferase
MMVRRTVFEELGGFDERLRVEYGDVDFCLRVGAKGYRVIYTPYAVLRHEEGGTRGREGRPSDPQEFRRRWHQLLRDGDPYYNPNLDRLARYRIRLTKQSSQRS